MERYFRAETEIKISCDEPGAKIRYTLDGSDPTKNSALYTAPFKLDQSAMLKARSFAKGSHPSFPASAEFTRLKLHNAIITSNLLPGLQAGYCVQLADMKRHTILRNNILPKFDISAIKDNRSFGYYFKGYLNIPETGIYTFYLNSNDGSNLTIDGKLELVNDGFHRAQERICKIELEKGFHSIAVDYFQMGGAKALALSWAFENGGKEEIPAEALFHENIKN